MTNVLAERNSFHSVIQLQGSVGAEHPIRLGGTWGNVKLEDLYPYYRALTVTLNHVLRVGKKLYMRVGQHAARFAYFLRAKFLPRCSWAHLG